MAGASWAHVSTGLGEARSLRWSFVAIGVGFSLLHPGARFAPPLPPAQSSGGGGLGFRVVGFRAKVLRV